MHHRLTHARPRCAISPIAIAGRKLGESWEVRCVRNGWRPGTLSGSHVTFDQLGDLFNGAQSRKMDEDALKIG